MRHLIFFILFLLLPILGFSQATTLSLGTSSNGVLSSTYNTWTKVDPNLTITAHGTITGFSVQISQTYTSGDQLRSTATLPTGLSASFNTTKGILVFSGTAMASALQTFLEGWEFKLNNTHC